MGVSLSTDDRETIQSLDTWLEANGPIRAERVRAICGNDAEWLMGLPAGWITDVPGITWNETLKACGNGVLWQQCAAALRFLQVMATWGEVAA